MVLASREPEIERFKYDGNARAGDIIEFALIELYTDNTNDSGDFFQYCLDVGANGGSAPQTDDILINYTGHNQLTLYKGTGTGWAPWTAPASAAYWIFELTMDRSDPSFDTSAVGYAPCSE
jgi:hypothetical protein